MYLPRIASSVGKPTRKVPEVKKKLHKWRISLYIDNRLDVLVHGQEVPDGTQLDSSVYTDHPVHLGATGILLMAAYSVCRAPEIKEEIGMVMAKVTNPARGKVFDQPDLPWDEEHDDIPPDEGGF